MKNPGLLLPNENTPAVLLLKRLRKEFPQLHIPKNAKLVRLYPGYWQRSGGAWSWQVETERLARTRMPYVGSSCPMKECLRAKKLVASPPPNGVHEFEIWPEVETKDKP